MAKLKKQTEPHDVISDCVRNRLTKDDIELIAQIHIDPKYKALVKLLDNIVLDLENKVFENGKTLEDFLGVVWTRKAIIILKAIVASNYNLVTSKRYAKSRSEEAPDLESFGQEFEVDTDQSSA